jgi:hypothetical protein
MSSSESVKGRLAAFCENGYEFPVSIKWVNAWSWYGQLPKKDLTLLSYQNLK